MSSLPTGQLSTGRRRELYFLTCVRSPCCFFRSLEKLFARFSVLFISVQDVIHQRQACMCQNHLCTHFSTLCLQSILGCYDIKRTIKMQTRIVLNGGYLWDYNNSNIYEYILLPHSTVDRGSMCSAVKGMLSNFEVLFYSR